MSIKQLKDGRYQVDVRPQGAEGKRIRKIFALKSKAQEFEKYVLQNFHDKPWQAKPELISGDYQSCLMRGGCLMGVIRLTGIATGLG